VIDEVTTRKPGPQALHGDGKLAETTAHASQKRSAYGWYTHYWSTTIILAGRIASSSLLPTRPRCLTVAVTEG
jgi:hypothetical protein